jgi:hypothetical protein
MLASIKMVVFWDVMLHSSEKRAASVFMVGKYAACEKLGEMQGREIQDWEPCVGLLQNTHQILPLQNCPLFVQWFLLLLNMLHSVCE